MNSKEEALTVAFRVEQSTGENRLEDLRKDMTEDVQRLPGNDLAKNLGNNSFNDRMEADLPSPSPKPTPSSDMTVRKDYITAKYVDHRFSRKTCSSSSAKLSELLEAIRFRDLLALIQVSAEELELTEALLEPGQEPGETALHLAVRTADQTSLHFVHFLVQNWGNLDKQIAVGNTALHYCSMYDKPEWLKLLLRSKPVLDVGQSVAKWLSLSVAGETTLDIAKRLKATQCEDLLSQAKCGNLNPCVHVEYDWHLRQEDMDESDDVLDDRPSPIKEELSSTPQSFCHSSSTSSQDELSLPGLGTPWDKQCLSYGAFANQTFVSTTTDLPTSPTSDASRLPPRNTGKGWNRLLLIPADSDTKSLSHLASQLSTRLLSYTSSWEGTDRNDPKRSLRDRVSQRLFRKKGKTTEDDSPNTSSRRPDQISVSEFIAETTEDCRSPTTSSFTTRMQSCKNTITLLEEALDEDRAVLQKMKESVKAMYDSGQDHVENQIKYAELLNMFGSNILNKDNSDVGTALVKFSALTEDLSILQKTLLQGLNDNVILTLESLLEGDLKEMKGDLRQSFDEAWKDYETKFTEIEKDQEYTEIAGAETSKKMEQERHLFQLQMCEYLIKVNETKTKKSVDLLQNLIEYNRAQCRFFQDGLKMAHTLKQSIKKLAGDIVNIKQTQDEEKKQLTSLRDLIKSSLQVEQKEDSQCCQVGNSLHQQHGNKEYSVLKIDYILKKSTGIRKVWQRRMCAVRRGTLIVPHAATNRQATTVDLLTCQVKPDTKDDRRFYVISQNRTYHLQAKDQQECAVWISAITKSKEEAQTMAFRREERENSLEDDTNALEDIQRISGDDMCCDSGSAGPTGPPSTLPLKTQTSSGSSTLSKKRPPPPPPGHKRTLSILPAHYLTGPQTKRRSLGATTIQPPPDVTTKPRCADLLQKNTLPPKTQLGDVLAKSQAEDVPPEAQLPRDVTTRPRPVDLCPKGPTGDSIEKQASEDSNDLTPVLPPQKSIRGRYMMPTVKAMYDCQADEDDELTFFAGELIHVTGMEEPGWWIGYIEGQRERKGVFPVSYVDVMRDNIQHN